MPRKRSMQSRINDHDLNTIAVALGMLLVAGDSATCDHVIEISNKLAITEAVIASLKAYVLAMASGTAQEVNWLSLPGSTKPTEEGDLPF